MDEFSFGNWKPFLSVSIMEVSKMSHLTKIHFTVPFYYNLTLSIRECGKNSRVKSPQHRHSYGRTSSLKTLTNHLAFATLLLVHIKKNEFVERLEYPRQLIQCSTDCEKTRSERAKKCFCHKGMLTARYLP